MEVNQWDAAVEAYGRARLNAGPTIDLTEPANHHTGPWRDTILETSLIEHSPFL